MFLSIGRRTKLGKELKLLKLNVLGEVCKFARDVSEARGTAPQRSVTSTALASGALRFFLYALDQVGRLSCGDAAIDTVLSEIMSDASLADLVEIRDPGRGHSEAGDLRVRIERMNFDLAEASSLLGTRLGEIAPVFPRADKSAIERMQSMEEQQRDAGVVEAKPEAAAPPANVAPVVQATATPVEAAKISIDDFSKIELRVGIVKVAERVPKADKLLRLEIDIGTEVRQVLAGIAEAYAPETLLGRKVVIVANLAPRKLRGMESNGMIVAASLEGGKPVLAGFLEDVPVGARLK